ncbi:hypothetical protein NKH18_29180 [Streptomyces sp. M10(2022)]
MMTLLRFADLGVSGLEIAEWDDAILESQKRISRVLQEALGTRRGSRSAPSGG